MVVLCPCSLLLRQQQPGRLPATVHGPCYIHGAWQLQDCHHSGVVQGQLSILSRSNVYINMSDLDLI